MALPGVFDKTGIDSGWFSDESKPEGWFDDNLLTSSGAAPSGITGNLASTDSGADTAALSGVLLAQGALSATDSGADTSAISGAVLASGSLSAIDSGADFFGASCSVALGEIAGALVVTDSGADTAALEGVALVSGSVAATESGADSTAISGALLAHGDLAATDGGADTFSAAGVVDSILSAITGVFDAIESGADSFFATNIDQKPAPGGAGGSWVIPRKKRKRENDEAFLLAVLI